MLTDQAQPSGDSSAAPATQSFHWLPRSLAWRAVLAVVAVLFTGLVFSAYLNPGLVFDLANTVFCG